MARQPQRPRANRRIDADFLPPCGFIAAAVECAMVTAAERNSEFIANLAAKCLALHKAQMMCIRRPPAAGRRLGKDVGRQI